MKRRFLVLIDFSPYSANLLRYANDWSDKAHAELVLVHHTTVLLPMFADIESKTGMTKIVNDNALKQLKEFAHSHLPGSARVKYVATEENLTLFLARKAKEPNKNIVFLGLKGTGIMKKIFIGSIAVQVIEQSEDIVVAIPKNVAAFSSNKVHVAVSPNYPLNIISFNNFLKLTENRIEKATFFSLAKSDDDLPAIEKYLKDLSDLFADKIQTGYELYYGNNSFQNIKSVINKNTDELLVVQKGSRLLTDQIFRKFVINELVYDGETPLVVLP